MKTHKLEQQILNLLDGQLSSEEINELEKALRNNEEALETYIQLVDLHNALETRVGMTTPKRIQMNRSVGRQMRGIAKKSLLVAAAALVVLAATLAIILAPPTPMEVATIKVTPGSQYRLLYEGEGKPPEDESLVVGSRLILNRGAFEGVFSSGVRLVAESPCDLRIVAKDKVAIQQGHVWFRVPAKARGFTAETPELRVVDLGTEFGVVSLPNDRDEVHVLEGSVEVSPLRENRQIEILQAGMARSLAPQGGLEEVKVNASHFRRTLGGLHGVISNFDFERPAWSGAKQSNFDAFAASASSSDTDELSSTSTLSQKGYTAGGYGSFYIKDSDIGTSIFSTSATPYAGMNIAGAHQSIPTNYISFTVTPDPGCRTTFERLSFFTDVNGANDTYNMELRAWDGRKETLLGSVTHTTGPVLNDPVVMKSIDFPDFSSTEPIEFRLYGYNVNSELRGIRYDDITLIGTSSIDPADSSPVPES